MIDETWRDNDGLVNTISAMAPSGATQKKLDRQSIEPGVWNVFPTMDGDHMWPQGGLGKRTISAIMIDELREICPCLSKTRLPFLSAVDSQTYV